TTTYVIQTEPVTELDAGRLAAVFAANPQFNVWPGFASQIARDFHQAADAFLIDRRKRIGFDDIELTVSGKKASGIVPAHSQCRLGEIVCAETEKLGITRNLIRNKRGARNFDHCPDKISEFRVRFLCHFTGYTPDDVDLKITVARTSHQWNHDFRTDLDSFSLDCGSSFKDRPRLRFGNFRINDDEPAASMTEHGIKLVQLVHATRDVFNRDAELVRKLVLLRVIVRQKFMQRWIEKTNRGGQTL